jgi:hypothetical protein
MKRLGIALLVLIGVLYQSAGADWKRLWHRTEPGCELGEECEECGGSGNWTGWSGDDEHTQIGGCPKCDGSGRVKIA